MATTNFCVITAKDLIKKKGDYSLHIYHVISFHGNGFKAIVGCVGSTIGTEFSLGENESSYEKVKEEGLKLLMIEDKKSRNDLNKLRAQWRKRKLCQREKIS